MPGPGILFKLVSALLAWRHASCYPTDCQFPENLQGTWFQSGVHQLIHITDKEVSTKGNCTLASAQKYVVHNKGRRCYRCVVFYEKHVNVIQYKESFCSPDSERPDLASLCGHVTGDRQLYSMFRVDYRPIECPLRGPFTFSYSRGHMMHQECSRPMSRLERCNHNARMLFRYQACTDVAGAEEAVEEMECLGVWKEGSARYLVTHRISPTIVSYEDRFRCFIYERAKPNEESWLDYRLAESAEATCSGLFRTSDGTRRLKLHMVGSYNKCQFPPWTTVHRRWHSLDRRTSYQFNRKNTSLTVIVGAQQETRMECAEIIDVSTHETLLVVRATTGCGGGFQCVAFYRRDGHVMESQSGLVTDRPDDACSKVRFVKATADYHTIVASSPRHTVCPHLGRYSVDGMAPQTAARRPDDRDVRDLATDSERFKALHVGCRSEDLMVLSGNMGVQPRAFSCQASWRDKDTVYLVASPSGRSWGSTRHFCFASTLAADGLRFLTVRRSCSRAVSAGADDMLSFNVTARAECLTSGAVPNSAPHVLLAVGALLVARRR